jgi:hypothetical protein
MDKDIEKIVNKFNNLNIDTNVIKIQKITRGYLIRNKILIPSSFYQTKTWRKHRIWYKDGKHNECEIYQRDVIEKIIGEKCNKTNERINMEDMLIYTKISPLKSSNGFEWTENFDGSITKKGTSFYFNLKFVCDSGGAQTRSLREVYMFVKCQISNIILHNTNNVYINIMDGNECYSCKSKFEYLFHKPNYETIRKNVFIGDMKEFQIWWNKYYK